jgi:putative PIN family toxin of toxin-antitoxin system
MPRAVLDSSVLVSAFLSPAGAPAELLAKARTGAFMLCLAGEVLAETAEVLLRPKHRKGRRHTPELVDRFCDDLLAVAEPVSDFPALHVVPGDPKDDMVVATAIAARAITSSPVTGGTSCRWGTSRGARCRAAGVPGDPRRVTVPLASAVVSTSG